MKTPLRNVVRAVLMVLMLSSLSFAGTTGKIVGAIIDKQTGEPMPGANIVLIGTKLGASTDLSGHYTILHVPPGERALQVTMIGYAAVTVNDVRVNIDQTARVDVGLEMMLIDALVGPNGILVLMMNNNSINQMNTTTGEQWLCVNAGKRVITGDYALSTPSALTFSSDGDVCRLQQRQSAADGIARRIVFAAAFMPTGGKICRVMPSTVTVVPSPISKSNEG